MTQLLKAVKDVGIDYFYVDRLNPRFGVWPSLKGVLQEHFPALIEMYRKLLFDERARREYSERLATSVNYLVKKQGLDGRMKLCF